MGVAVGSRDDSAVVRVAVVPADLVVMVAAAYVGNLEWSYAHARVHHSLMPCQACSASLDRLDIHIDPSSRHMVKLEEAVVTKEYHL